MLKRQKDRKTRGICKQVTLQISCLDYNKKTGRQFERQTDRQIDKQENVTKIV